MLTQLYIRHFTLINELDIRFNRGFSVITGETGAGKSIILGAIGLLLGQRADTKSIKAGEDRCTIEAHFDISRYNLRPFFEENDIDYDENDCILRRELTVAGKSRSFINDTPVSLSLMRELGESLVDIHSQHQNLLLQKEDFQLNVVDIIANDKKQREEYRQAFRQYDLAKKALADFEEQCAKNRENEEFLRFQFSELDKAALETGEQEELEKKTQTLSHIEEIKSGLFEASQLLTQDATGAVEEVKGAADSLQRLVSVFPDIDEAAQRLDSSLIELRDIADEVDRRLQSIDFDPQEFQQATDRLDLIYSLEKKFHVSTVEDLIAEHDRVGKALSAIDGGGEALEEKRQEVACAHDKCKQAGAALTVLRQKAARLVEKEMQRRLAPLGIPKVRFSIDMQPTECTTSGMDKVSFLFSANSSTPLQPVAQVASGGEIARVMLSLKAMISGAVKLPTIIFDEIDTGVSGSVAEKMAETMREMGQQHRQVIAITHLPQIAAMGTTHYKVSKAETSQGTISKMRKLTDNERVSEIAQMLSGSNITQAAMDNARELLANAQKA